MAGEHLLDVVQNAAGERARCAVNADCEVFRVSNRSINVGD